MCKYNYYKILAQYNITYYFCGMRKKKRPVGKPKQVFVDLAKGEVRLYPLDSTIAVRVALWRLMQKNKSFKFKTKKVESRKGVIKLAVTRLK